MTTIDLETLTEEEMRKAGWTKLGTRQDPHWTRKTERGEEHYYGQVGRRSTTTATATVSRVVMSRLAYDGIRTIIDNSFDGREVGSLGICELRGNEIHLIEAAPDGLDDDRWNDAMRLYDSRAHMMEEYRLSQGIPHYASWAWHVHPEGSARMSDADIFAFSVRARDNVCHGYFVAIILARSQGSEGFDITECYLVSKDGRWRSVPIVLDY
jgi:hypothetical protein